MGNIFDEVTDKDIAEAMVSRRFQGEAPAPGVFGRVSEAIRGFGQAIEERVSPFTGEAPFRIAEALSPGTPAQAAGDVALGLTGFGPGARALSRLGRPGVAAGARVGIPTAAAAGVGELTGEGTGAGIPFAVGAGLGEAGGVLIRKVKGTVGELAFPARLIKQGREDTDSVLFAISREVKGFPLHSGQKGLRSALDPRRDQQWIRDQFQKVDDMISANLKGYTMGSNTVIDENLNEIKQVMRALGVRAKSIEELPGAIKTIKATARKLPPTAENFLVREQARDAEGAYRNILENLAPPIRVAYDKAVITTERGFALLDAIRKSGAVIQTRQGLHIDLAQLGRFLLQPENVNKYPFSKYPRLWNAVSRGGEKGAIDQLVTILRGERFGIRPPGMGGSPVSFATAGLPAVSLLKKAGPQPSLLSPVRPGAQTAADLLLSTSIQGLGGE